MFIGWANDNNLRDRSTARVFQIALNKIIKSYYIRIDGKQVKGYSMNRVAFTEAICRHLRMTLEELAEYL